MFKIDGDLVISLKSVPYRLSKGRGFITPRARVFVKKKNGYKPVGMIHKIMLSADVKKIPVKIETTFPEHPKLSDMAKKVIQDNINSVEKLGVIIKKYRLKEKKKLTK